jgi:hypothetical protein
MPRGRSWREAAVHGDKATVNRRFAPDSDRRADVQSLDRPSRPLA